jgi:RHS repeat-associated protein
MELAPRTEEEKIFSNITSTAVLSSTVPGGYPTDTTTNPNNYVSKLNGSGNKIGPSVVLKVMTGDKLNIAVKSFYRGQGAAEPPANILANVLTSLATGIVGSIGEAKGTLAALSNPSGSPLAGPLTTFSQNNATPTNKPKAYLNYVFLDDQFNVLPNSSSMVVGAADLLDKLAVSNLVAAKNGFVYIYVSNETPLWDVFFDNLQVSHTKSPLLEETHYYPFGLTMAGISSKTVGKLRNKFKFNAGTELNEEFDLHYYETNFRSLDPQVGRFWQIDPMAEAVLEYSPYSYANNNPITFNDPLGLLSDSANPEILKPVTVTAKKGVPKSFKGVVKFDNNRPGSIASDADWPLARYRDENHLLKSWAKGKGAENRIYLPHHAMTKRLVNANAVNVARAKFYKTFLADYKNGLSLKTATLLNEQLHFGVDGVLMAGFDIVEQFVGGMTIDMRVDESGENLMFIVRNTTGKKSGFYHGAEDVQRVPGKTTPMGNMNQIYIWKESLATGAQDYERALENSRRSMIDIAPGFN